MNAVVSAGASGAGASPYFDATVDETATQIKGSAGNLYKLHIENKDGSIRYLQLFDSLAASVTVGTTTPDYVIPLLATGIHEETFEVGLKFNTGISYALTTTPTGSTGPTSDGVLSAAYA